MTGIMFSSETKARDISLFLPGEMPEELFWLLVEISPIHSEKIIGALYDFLVIGLSRKEIYRRQKISPGHFSSALGKFQRTSFVVNQLSQYYKKSI